MKKNLGKILIISFSFILVFSSLFQTAFAANKVKFLYPANAGDVDGNSKITAGDARLALRIAVNIEKNVTDYMRLAADYDNNSKVTASDARSILRVSAKLDDHIFNDEEMRAVLNEYISMLNLSYKDKPGFSSIFYIDVPGDKENSKILASEEMLEVLEKLMGESLEDSLPDSSEMKITRDDALKEKIIAPKGSDMKDFPLLGRDVGAIDFDHKNIKSASITDAKNGNKLIKITLNNELNPKSLPENPSKNPESILSHMFVLFAQEDFIGNDINFEDSPFFSFSFDFDYFDCTAYLEYNPQTKKIVSLKHDVNFSIISLINIDPEMDDASFGFMQNIYATSEWFEFVY